MSRKIARITQDKKLLLANEVVESNAKTSLNSDGRLEVDEIIEYPDELEGGRNLLRNSNFNSGSEYWDGNFIITDEGALLESVAGRSAYIQNTTLIPEGEYTVQIKYRVVEGQAPYLYAVNGTNMRVKTIYVFEVGDNEWQTVTFPIIVNSESRFYAIRYAAGTPVDHLEGKTLIESIKLERGSQATPWTPAPEDLGLNYPDSIQNFNYSISGNNIIAPEFIEGYPFVKPVIDDSLVLWLDGSTGNNYKNTGIWKDLSGNGNDGELKNFDFTENSGWVDGGLKFDGVKKKDYVLFSKEMLVQGCSFSIDFWTKLSGIGTNCFFCTRTVLGDGVAIFALSGNKIRFDTGRRYQWKTSYDIPTNELVNIVVTKDDNYKKLYVNGKPYSSTRTVGDMSNLSNVSTIGASQIDNKSYDNFLKGDIYSFRIYNRALTDEEILQNYQAGQCSPLLAMRGDAIG